MVKVSGGARTVGGVEQHMAYIGRDGALDYLDRHGRGSERKGSRAALVQEWNLAFGRQQGIH